MLFSFEFNLIFGAKIAFSIFMTHHFVGIIKKYTIFAIIINHNEI